MGPDRRLLLAALLPGLEDRKSQTARKKLVSSARPVLLDVTNAKEEFLTKEVLLSHDLAYRSCSSATNIDALLTKTFPYLFEQLETAEDDQCSSAAGTPHDSASPLKRLNFEMPDQSTPQAKDFTLSDNTETHDTTQAPSPKGELLQSCQILAR